MGWGAIAAGIGAAGGIFGSAMSGIWSGKAARQQRKWQERMSRHAYRYTMEDMRAAGLNPILAYKQGPVTAGGGALAHVPDLGDAITGGMATGASAAESAGRLRKQKPETALLEASAQAQAEAAKTQKTQQLLNTAATAEASARQVKTNTEQAILQSTLPHAQAIGKWYQTPEGVKAAIFREQAMPVGNVAGAAVRSGLPILEGALNSTAKQANDAGKKVNQWLRSDSIWQGIKDQWNRARNYKER